MSNEKLLWSLLIASAIINVAALWYILYLREYIKALQDAFEEHLREQEALNEAMQIINIRNKKQ